MKKIAYPLLKQLLKKLNYKSLNLNIMDNLQQPAYPISVAKYSSGEISSYDFAGQIGFTKLELASLMIAQGMFAGGQLIDISNIDHIAHYATIAAIAILNQANKR